MQSERNKAIRNAKARIRHAIRRAGLELAKANGTIVALRGFIGQTELCAELSAVDRAIAQIGNYSPTREISATIDACYHSTQRKIAASTTRDSIADDAETSVQP